MATEDGGIWRGFLVPLLPKIELKFASAVSAGDLSALALAHGGGAVFPEHSGAPLNGGVLEKAVFLSSGLTRATVALCALETLITVSCSYLFQDL